MAYHYSDYSINRLIDRYYIRLTGEGNMSGLWYKVRRREGIHEFWGILGGTYSQCGRTRHVCTHGKHNIVQRGLYSRCIISWGRYIILFCKE